MKESTKLTLQKNEVVIRENIRQHKILLWQLDRKSANAMLINNYAV